MRKYISILLFVIMLTSCSEDNARKSETSQFLGKWKLIEQLVDPGDGSGTFQPVNGNKTLEFLSNGNVVSNYELCNFMGPEGSANFTLPYVANQDYILPNGCGFAEGFNISYSINGENLILNFPCIEGCAQKFERVIQAN